jgi:hypothetical protein
VNAPAGTGGFSLPGNPVFIVGYPRSGTTLLQAMVSTFPRFFSFPETHFFNVVRKGLQIDESGCIDEGCIDSASASFTDKAAFSLPDDAVADLKRRCREGCLRPRDFFETFVRHMLLALYPDEPFAESFRWVEKTPNHAYFLDDILVTYPDALFLNIVRHPVAAISSRRRAFAANRETPTAELARLWNRSVEAAEEFGRRHPERIRSLRYEDLAEDPERDMRAVAAFLGAEYSAGSLKGFGTAGTAIRHDWETWKEGVSRGDTYDGNASHFALMPMQQTLVIQRECRRGMERWGYRPLRPIRQKLYTLTGWPGPGAGRPS